MKVLMLNGSPHAKGCTYTALHEMEKIFRQEGISCELIPSAKKESAAN
jgi:multimeric flavodoxin WrbA